MIWPKRYVCPLLVLAQYGLMKVLPGRPVQITADGCLVRFWNSRAGFVTRATADVAGAVWRTEHERL